MPVVRAWVVLMMVGTACQLVEAATRWAAVSLPAVVEGLSATGMRPPAAEKLAPAFAQNDRVTCWPCTRTQSAVSRTWPRFSTLTSVLLLARCILRSSAKPGTVVSASCEIVVELPAAPTLNQRSAVYVSVAAMLAMDVPPRQRLVKKWHAWIR